MALLRRKRDPEPDPRETGATGQTQYGSLVLSEYNPDLRGANAIRTYDQMRRSDGQVKASLRLVKTPISSAQWYVEPASQDPRDLEIARFVEWALFELLDTPWPKFINEALFMLDFGFYAFEKIFEVLEDKVVWKNFSPRHPQTLDHWEFDSAGHVTHMVHRRIDGETGAFQLVRIPRSKLLVFTLDEESGNPSGTSILRSAYKHWYYKENLYKVDAIQKERHGIGIPVVHLPPGYTDEDKKLANQLGANLRTNEKAHVTLPPGWELDMLTMNTNLVNVLESIVHHNQMIAANVLGQFLELGTTRTGARAVAGDLIGLFFRALRYVADIIRAELNVNAIPELVNYNFSAVTQYPKLRVRRIGETADWRALSAAIRNLKEAGFLTPNDETEEWLRDQMDFPEIFAARSPEARVASGRPTPPPRQTGTQDDSEEQAAREGNRSESGGDRVPPEGNPIGGR